MPIKDGDVYTLRVGKGSRTTYKIEVVVSPPALKQGLSGRPHLPAGHGMFFVFGSVAKQGMWMIDMRFPLDIVWLDENMTVVHITWNAPPCQNANQCPNYSSVKRVKYAIEMTAGEAAHYGFAVGKQLTVV
jgi:uncharacterized protein